MVNEIRMSFGKYRGYMLNAIPDAYLQWLLKQPYLLAHTRRDIQNELKSRDDNHLFAIGTTEDGSFALIRVSQ